MKWSRILTFILILKLILLPILIGISTYYFIGGNSINTLLNGLIAFFVQVYARDQNSFGLAGITILMILSQFFSGYAFNKINRQTKKEQVINNIQECFKESFKKNVNTILKYIANMNININLCNI